MLTNEEKAELATLVRAEGEETPKPVETPAPTPTPAPAEKKPETPAPDDERIDALIEANKQTLAALADLETKMVEGARARGDERPEDEIKAELEDESPGVRRLADLVAKQEKRIEKLLGIEEEREVAAQKEAATQALVERWNAESDETMKRFPGMTEDDARKVYDYLGKNPQEAVRVSWGMAAEKVLGMDYLDARRTPIGIDPAKAGKKPEAPSATVVTHSSGGAGGMRAPTPASTGGDVRDAFAEIRRDPGLIAALGRYE